MSGRAIPMRYRPARSRGFSLIEVAMALGVASAALVGFIQMQADASQTVKAISVATKLNQVYLASQDYIKDNYSPLLAQIPVNGVVNVGVGRASATSGYPGTPIGLTNLPSLQGGGYLPSSYIDRNAFNQFTALLIKHVPAIGSAPEHLEAMITTISGQNVRDRDLQTIAAKVQAPGGMMLAKPLPSSGAAGQNVQGVYGGWASPASDWQSAYAGVGPQIGHSMVTFAFNQNGVMSDFLNRYAVPGTTEPNRMHTSIDANGNNLNNVQNTDTQSIGNSRSGQVQVNSFLNILNGGEACAANSTGCSWRISDDGAFVDNNDYWITFRGDFAGKGLKITGPGNNLQVGGQTESIGMISADNGVHIRGDWLRVDNDNGIVFRDNLGDPGGFYMSDSTWIRTFNNSSIYSGNGIIRSDNQVQGPLFVDTLDGSYYLAPSRTSHLNEAIYQGDIATNGYDPHNGLPSGWGGGVHAWDVYAEGALATGKNGSLATYINSNGDMRTIGRLGTMGYDPNTGYPSGVAGGIHTWDDYAEGGVYVGPSGTVHAHIYNTGDAGFDGSVDVARHLQLGTAGQDYPGNWCAPNGSLGAKGDGSGVLLTCVNGTWQTPTAKTTSYVPTTGNGSSIYNQPNQITGGTYCPSGTNDTIGATLWYGSYGFSALHLCVPQ